MRLSLRWFALNFDSRPNTFVTSTLSFVVCFFNHIDLAGQVRESMRKKMLAHRRMWLKVTARTDTWWLNFQRRSVLRFTLASEAMETLNSGADVDGLTKVLKRIFMNVGHSGLVEDAFQRMRRQEDLNESGPRMASNRVYKIPSDAGLLESVYSFHEVKAEEIPERKVESLPQGFFSPGVSETSVPLTDIASSSTTSHWPSFSPPFLQFAEDLGVLESLHDKPDKVNCIWRTVFLHQNLICKHKKTEGHFLSFGTSSLGYCALLWPVQSSLLHLKKKTLTLWKLKEITKPEHLKWMPVIDFSEWVIVPTNYLSPLQIYSQNANATPGFYPNGFMVQCEKETPLLKYAAQKGFWHINLQTLKKLCKDFSTLSMFPVSFVIQ